MQTAGPTQGLPNLLPGGALEPALVACHPVMRGHMHQRPPAGGPGFLLDGGEAGEALEALCSLSALFLLMRALGSVFIRAHVQEESRSRCHQKIHVSLTYLIFSHFSL